MNNGPDIGDVLRKARNLNGWSLEDVAHQTRIQIEILHALEENDYSGFPSAAYAKSFLGQYADHLGVDALDWLDAFESDDPLAHLDRYEYLKEPEEFLGPEPVPEKKQERRTKAAQTTASSSYASLQPLVVFAITAALITGGITGFLHLSERLATESAEATPESRGKKPVLQPIPRIPDSRPAPPNVSNAARAIPAEVEPSALRVGGPASESLSHAGAGADDNAEVATRFVAGNPPPRAVIVEE